MKKIIPFWPIALFILAISGSVVQCNPKAKKPGTILVTDTIKPIDTTIIEDGVAPIATNVDAKIKPDKQKKEKIICSFNLKKLNQHKRTDDEAPGGKKGKPVKPGTQPPPPPPPPPPSTAENTIYLNFTGKTVSGTMWNVNGDFTVDVSGFGQVEITAILGEVRAIYKDYNVNITDDKAVFDATPIGHRVEVVVTESWEWYGQAGGVAYIGSFTWGDGSPAFVFSGLLSYNIHYVAEAAAHEAGHTLGLRHQSDCVNGVLTNQYSNGWVMGVGYYVPQGMWNPSGTNPFCALQNDQAMLEAAVGLKQIAYNFDTRHWFALKHQSSF
jgi:hypothetical protein